MIRLLLLLIKVLLENLKRTSYNDNHLELDFFVVVGGRGGVVTSICV